MNPLRLEELIAEVVARRDRGEHVDIDAFIGAHPEHRDELQRALGALDAAESLFPRTDAGAPKQLGPWSIRGTLGRGGSGTVYDAVHADGTPAALKVLDAAASPRSIERLRREARTLGRLQHDGIVRVLDVGTDDGRTWVAIARIDGPPLDRVLDAGLDLPGEGSRTTRALTLVAHLARAVAVAHDAGVLHRDLKPANVLIDGARPVLIDFGLAADDTADTLTRTGDLLGTPAYMAPEQARGESATPRTDVYGLGAILLALVAARAPQGGRDSGSVMEAVRTRPFTLSRRERRSLPRDLRVLLERALAFEPRHRIASAATMADDLESIARGESIRTRPFGVVEHVSRLVASSACTSRVGRGDRRRRRHGAGARGPERATGCPRRRSCRRRRRMGHE